MSPFIQVDLDAKKKFPLVARGLGISVAEVALAFLEMWEPCFGGKKRTVSRVELECLFGVPSARSVPVLVEYGFLTPDGELFRIRGSGRYSVAAEARSRGGKAASGNLKRGTTFPGSSREAAGDSAGKQPRLNAGSRVESRESIVDTEATTFAGTSGAPPAVEQVELLDEASAFAYRQAEAPASQKPKREKADPRFAPVKAMLVRVFEELRGCKYLFSGAKDSEAIKRMLPVGDDAEIELRWRFGLRAKGFDRCESIAELSAKWNRYTTGPPRKKPRQGPPLPNTAAGVFWGRALEILRSWEKDYALEWLERMRPTDALNGELHLEAPDKHFVSWVEDHYQDLLTEVLAELQLKPVIHVAPEQKEMTA